MAFRKSDITIALGVHLGLLALVWHQRVVPPMSQIPEEEIKVFLYQPPAPAESKQDTKSSPALESEPVEPASNAQLPQPMPEAGDAVAVLIEAPADDKSPDDVAPVAVSVEEAAPEPDVVAEVTDEPDDKPLALKTPARPAKSAGARSLRSVETVRKQLRKQYREQWIGELRHGEHPYAGLSVMQPQPENVINPGSGDNRPAATGGQTAVEIVRRDSDGSMIVEANGSCFKVSQADSLDSTSSGMDTWSFSSACGSKDDTAERLKQSLNKFLSKKIK